MWAILSIISLIMLFASVGMFIYGSIAERKQKVYRRFVEVLGLEQKKVTTQRVEDELLQGSFYERILKPLIQKFADRFAGKKSTKFKNKLQHMILQAGNPGNITPNEFIAIQMLSAMISITLVLLIGIMTGLNTRNKILLTIIGMAVAAGFSFILPKFWLSSKITKRIKEIRKSLPDAIDLLVVCVEAGLGFDMALSKVVEKFKGALAEEFKKALDEIKLGTPRKEALKNITKRVEVEELSSFVSAVVQAEQLGASIAKVLNIQSEQMRIKRRQLIEEQAMKAPVKMLFPMLLFIFPTIFIVVMGPVGLDVYLKLSGSFL